MAQPDEMDTDCKKMAELNDMDAECKKKLITIVFRDIIEQHLNPIDKAVISMLPSGLITTGDYQEMMVKNSSEGPTAAIRVLIQKIEISQDPHIYRKFLDALTNSDNQNCIQLSKDIQGISSPESAENGAIFQRLIKIYSPDLMDVQPRQILPYLDCLSAADKERILATCEMSGNIAAALCLVLALSRCAGDSWCTDFLWALRQCGQHNSLADKLEEGFSAKKDPSGKSFCKSMETKSKDNHKDNYETEMMDGIETHQDEYESSGDEYHGNEGGQPDDDEHDDGAGGNSVNMNSFEEEEKAGLRSPFEQGEKEEEKNNPRNISEEKQEEEGTEKQPSLDSSPSAAAPPQLYEDQLEVALPAIEGRNTLIIMPTGAGKTVVAAKIIEDMINNAEDKLKCKAIFMGPLVKQQADRLVERLRPSNNFKIIGIKGDTMTVPLKEVLVDHNVIVLTAAILDTALKDGGEYLVDLDSLLLLVFDECHHCMKDHVYNSIMKRYMYEKFEYPSTKLPQVIGLTATPGTGKAKSQVAAEEHVFQLCANLDIHHISVVERNHKRLQERINIPEQVNPICVDGREEDPFKDQVCRIMLEIEEIIKRCPASSVLPGIRSIPNDKKAQAYMQWSSKLDKDSGETVEDGEQLRVIRTCVKHLQDYHVALGINAEVRTSDAVNFLKTKYNEMNDPERMETFNDTDYSLLRKFMSKRREFGEVSKDPKYHNPLLKTLEDILIREFRQRPQSRALLFCQTVEATKALMTWIQETDAITFLHPNRMVGGKNMTSAQHMEILERFKEGKHKLLVATNVLEEGIDVAECNLVIRLNYVPSDTGHVQVKGRSRAKNSKCYLIASSDCDHAVRELANKARFDMSTRAINSLGSIPPAQFHDLINRRQKEDYQLQKLKTEAIRDNRPLHHGEFQLLCGRCKKYACSTLDIGVYNFSQHIVQCEEFVMVRAKVSRHPRPKQIDENYNKIGKIHCMNCNFDWGILAIICQQKLPIIKISGFIIQRQNDDGSTNMYTKEKWKDAKKIFSVRELKREDLQTMKKMNIPDF